MSAVLLRQAAASKTFVVTELEARNALRLGFAAAASGPHGTFVAYAEEVLPADRRAADRRARPVPAPELNLAIYLGRSQANAALLETEPSAPLPLRGPTYTTRIPFGDTVLTIRLPMSSRSGFTGPVLPWPSWRAAAGRPRRRRC